MNDESRGNYARVNGLEMYYEVHGKGEPLILLHGGVGAIEMFGEVLCRCWQKVAGSSVSICSHMVAQPISNAP